ncbi:MAG: cyclic nucleotide-binding domain-containing protein [Chthoniobacterales bacterium]
MPGPDFFAFCTSLQPIELRAMGALSQVRHIPEGETIYSPGDAGDTLYIINRGLLEMVLANAKARVAGTYLSRGDVFGDLEVLTGIPRKQSVHTREPVSLQCFDRKDFPELVRRVPAFFRYLAEQLAGRLLLAHDAGLAQSHCLELSGNLANFDLVTVYQTIVNSAQTGELSICNEEGELISAFFFEAGHPRSGQFQHLSGEEAFWQLFLTEALRGTFSFSSGRQKSSKLIQDEGIIRSPEHLLINAIQSRDELDAIRSEIPGADSLLTRANRDLQVSEIEPPSLRPVAEEVWRRLFARPMSLPQLYQHLSVSELKIYQVASLLLRSGHLEISTSAVAENAGA